MSGATTTAAAADSRRNERAIQSLRGIAVLLMVAGHVIGHEPSRGLQAGDGSFLRVAYVFLEDVRMPFFTVLSGWVYALRPVTRAPQLPSFMTKKVRRILLPMVAVGLVQLGLMAVAPGVNARPGADAVFEILFFGFEHLWFLQAIFVIFLIVALLDTGNVMWGPRSWTLLVLGTGVVGATVRIPQPFAVFSINQALWLLPFFLFGVGLRRFATGRGSTAGRVGVVVGAALLLAIGTYLYLDHRSLPVVLERGLGMLTGALGVLAMYLHREKLTSRALVWIGGFSYGIYLLHVLGAASSRIVLSRLGVESIPVLFAAGLALGVGVPIILERTIGRLPLVATVVFGKALPVGVAPLAEESRASAQA